jgi:predicted transcriptional regulator
MAVKVTYTLDDATVTRIRRLADRTRKPQSAVVREAVAYYAAREDSLTAEERERKLAALRELRTRQPQPGDKTAEDVDRELRELRRARRSRGRLHPVD